MDHPTTQHDQMQHMHLHLWLTNTLHKQGEVEVIEEVRIGTNDTDQDVTKTLQVSLLSQIPNIIRRIHPNTHEGTHKKHDTENPQLREEGTTRNVLLVMQNQENIVEQASEATKDHDTTQDTTTDIAEDLTADNAENSTAKMSNNARHHRKQKINGTTGKPKGSTRSSQIHEKDKGIQEKHTDPIHVTRGRDPHRKPTTDIEPATDHINADQQHQLKKFNFQTKYI